MNQKQLIIMSDFSLPIEEREQKMKEYVHNCHVNKVYTLKSGILKPDGIIYDSDTVYWGANDKVGYEKEYLYGKGDNALQTQNEGY